jgi:hypothetical protein
MGAVTGGSESGVNLQSNSDNVEKLLATKMGLQKEFTWAVAQAPPYERRLSLRFFVHPIPRLGHNLTV